MTFTSTGLQAWPQKINLEYANLLSSNILMFHGCIRYVSLELLCCFSNCWVVDRRVGDCLLRILVVCRQIVSHCFGYYMFLALLTGAISYSLVYFQSKITLMEVVKKDISINEVTKEYDFGLDRMVEKKICGQLSLVY